MPGPDLSDADIFSPPPGFVPVLPGGDFLYRGPSSAAASSSRRLSP
jgi:hypothetical protein